MVVYRAEGASLLIVHCAATIVSAANCEAGAGQLRAWRSGVCSVESNSCLRVEDLAAQRMLITLWVDKVHASTKLTSMRSCIGLHLLELAEPEFKRTSYNMH